MQLNSQVILHNWLFPQHLQSSYCPSPSANIKLPLCTLSSERNNRQITVTFSRARAPQHSLNGADAAPAHLCPQILTVTAQGSWIGQERTQSTPMLINSPQLLEELSIVWTILGEIESNSHNIASNFSNLAEISHLLMRLLLFSKAHESRDKRKHSSKSFCPYFCYPARVIFLPCFRVCGSQQLQGHLFSKTTDATFAWRKPKEMHQLFTVTSEHHRYI